MKEMMMRRQTRQQGVSIIEVMITLVINAIAVIAVIQLFSQSKGGYLQQDALARMQENGRFAIEYISRDLRYADFWGCVSNPSRVANNVRGANAGQFSGFSGSGLTGSDHPDSTGSDSISIARASNVSAPVVANMVNTKDVITIGINPVNLFAVGDVVAISDCRYGDIFTVTGITGVDTDGNKANDQWQIAHSKNDSSGVRANESDNLSFNYHTTAALFSRASAITYDIGIDATTGEPGLRRNNEIIIPGVEIMKIKYGEDTDADGAVDNYVDAGAVSDFANVVSVRVDLLVRTEDEVNSTPVPYTMPGITSVIPTDNRSRRILSATTTIRNHVYTATL